MTSILQSDGSQACEPPVQENLSVKGFTLVELMVVTAIAGVLGAVAIPRLLVLATLRCRTSLSSDWHHQRMPNLGSNPW